MRVRWPGLALHVAVAFIWACDSSAAPPVVESTVKLLTSSGDASARGGNALGQIVGLEFTEGMPPRAVLWSSLTADAVELPGRGGSTKVSALNRHGVAVGHDLAAGDPQWKSVAVRWVTGERQPLGIPAGWDGSSANDINDRGTVVGRVLSISQEAPFIWTSQAGFVLLDMPTPSEGGAAVRISECGAIAGILYERNGRAVVWDGPSAPARELATLPGGDRSGAYEINCDGEVVGYSSDESNDAWAVKWRANGVPSRLPNPAGLDVAFSWADGIDERGNAVGTLFILSDSSESFDTRPVLWPAGGGVIDLSTVVPGFVTGSPSAILPDGTIVGTVIDQSGGHAAAWVGFLTR